MYVCSVCMYVCMYECMSVTGLLLKYTIRLVYVPHCHVHALCYNDGENLGGPVTKTVNLLYAGRQETYVLGAECYLLVGK